MDLRFLDKSEGVTPILVRLYDNHKLYHFAKDKRPAARSELTSAVAELLDMPLSPREGELISDVLIALIRQAEKDLRKALSERLSLLDNAPLRVILNLVNDDIEVAAPVLKNSTVLGDTDLIYIIKSKGAESWPLIASRQTLSNFIIDTLSQTRDFNTALSLAKNETITLTQNALTVLADLARGHEMLAIPLLRRDEVSRDIAASLYEAVGAELKTYICEKFNIDRDDIKAAIETVTAEFVQEASSVKTAEADYMPSQDALTIAEEIARHGKLNIHYMQDVLKRGQVNSFVALFAKYFGLPPRDAVGFLKRPGGNGLALVCRAHGVMKADFIALFLLTGLFRDNGRVVTVAEIQTATKMYDKILKDRARAMLMNFVGVNQ